MKSKCCAYCKNEFGANRKRTAEHIFPQVLLKLFPEQDVSFTPEGIFKDNSGLTISDVCNICNNGVLSELDRYGGEIIKEQFIDEIDYEFKDLEIEKIINYELFSKWIIKISYNYLRSRKKDCAFMQQYISSILNNQELPSNFDILLGLHINTTPLPEKCYEYKPLEIVEDPELLGTCLQISALYNIRPEVNSIVVSGTDEKLLIRFGNAVMYVIFWNNECDDIVKSKYRELLTTEFNFVRLMQGKERYMLKRVSASSNISMNYWHLLSKSALYQDDMMVERCIRGSVKDTRKAFEDAWSKDNWKRSKLLVEMQMFPNNKKVKKEYKDVFGTEE